MSVCKHNTATRTRNYARSVHTMSGIGRRWVCVYNIVMLHEQGIMCVVSQQLAASDCIYHLQHNKLDPLSWLWNLTTMLVGWAMLCRICNIYTWHSRGIILLIHMMPGEALLLWLSVWADGDRSCMVKGIYGIFLWPCSYCHKGMYTIWSTYTPVIQDELK